MCYFIDIIDECIKELASTPPQPTTQLVELPAEEMLEEDEDEYHHVYA